MMEQARIERLVLHLGVYEELPAEARHGASHGAGNLFVLERARIELLHDLEPEGHELLVLPAEIVGRIRPERLGRSHAVLTRRGPIRIGAKFVRDVPKRAPRPLSNPS